MCFHAAEESTCCIAVVMTGCTDSDTKGLGRSADRLALMSTKTVEAEERAGSRSDALGGGGVPEILPRAPQYWAALRNEEQWEDTPLYSLFPAAGRCSGVHEEKEKLCSSYAKLGGKFNEFLLSLLLPLGTFQVTSREMTSMGLRGRAA